MADISYLGALALRCLRAVFRRIVGDLQGKGHFEVELKFSISGEESTKVVPRLKERGFTDVGTVTLADSFLPVAVQGEMMRVRQETGGKRAVTVLTFKQWVSTRSGRTRRESERTVPSTLALILLLLGRIVGGRTLLSFSKQRQLYDGTIGASDAVVSIDEVSGLGRFSGWYLEAEMLVPLGEDPADYQQPILEFVQKLFNDQRQPVKRSYFEMLVESLQQS